VKKIIRPLLFIILLSTAAVLVSCEGTQVAQPANETTAKAAGRYAAAPEDRPGLGTKWGETRASRVMLTDFVRADPVHPAAVGTIYYNDAAGIRAMTQASWHRGWSTLPVRSGSLIAVGLRDQSGRFLPGLIVGDKWFVVGEEGRRYSIVIRNKTNTRIEAVASVDGLDVLDGRKASLAKRGYLIPPRAERVIDGFRQSTEAVAAFRFGPVRESYANEKYHNTRNVGVIGVAVFDERGSDIGLDAEARKRLDAKPFPSRFATPP
jgi:hypothetical protein